MTTPLASTLTLYLGGGLLIAGSLALTPARSRLGPCLALGSLAALTVFLAEDPFGLLRLFAHALFVLIPLTLLVVRCQSRPTFEKRALESAAGALVLLGLWSTQVEPRWLEVTHERVFSHKLEQPLKIGIVADLQTDHIGAYEERVLERLKAEQPDLVLLTGDYLQLADGDRYAVEAENLRALLRRSGVDAPLGLWAVRGNTDWKRWTELFLGTPVVPLAQTESLDLGELRLTGLSLADSFSPALEVEATDRFHIVFGHGPDFALASPAADLLIAGHTHGGQVRLPGFGPPITFSSVPRSWAAGLTQLSKGRWLYVSRGVGMERGFAPRLRLFCRPELAFLTVEPATT